MKISNREETDRFGIFPALWIDNPPKTYGDLIDTLYREYGEGYKFAVLFSTMSSDIEYEKHIPVYLIDDILDEVIEYCGVDKVANVLKEKGVKQ